MRARRRDDERIQGVRSWAQSTDVVGTVQPQTEEADAYNEAEKIAQMLMSL